jgi:hypothetical protein
VLPPLERLSELVERVVVLLDEVPAPAPVAEERPQEEPAGHVLFVSSPTGYRLLERHGPAPERGEVLELEESRCRVLRLGPSPLPGDRRRCAFLEQDPPEQNRTPTS